MIFIDGSNLFKSFRMLYPELRYDISKLVSVLSENKKLIRPYYFGSERLPPSQGQRDFQNMLRYDGIDVTIRPLKIQTKTVNCIYDKSRKCELTNEIEKGIDVALVTKMISFGFKGIYDTAILISGDADYVEAIKEIKNLGKRVEVVSFPESIAPTLRKIAS
jgi:uncharacterized LabA/DUF88 family protein